MEFYDQWNLDPTGYLMSLIQREQFPQNRGLNVTPRFRMPQDPVKQALLEGATTPHGNVQAQAQQRPPAASSQTPAMMQGMSPKAAFMGQLGGALLSGMGPSTDPENQSFAGNLGKAFGPAMKGYQAAMQNEMTRKLYNQQLRSGDQQFRKGEREEVAAGLGVRRAAEHRKAVINKILTDDDYKGMSFEMASMKLKAEILESAKSYKLGPDDSLFKGGEKIAGGEGGTIGRAGKALTTLELAERGLSGDAVFVWGPKGRVPKKVSGKDTMEVESGLQTAIRPYRNAATELTTKAGIVTRALEKGNGAGDIAAIKTFERMVEDAVVRSDDIEMQNRAQSIKQRFTAAFANFTEGDILNDTKRSQLQGMANEMLEIGMTGNVLPNIEEIMRRAGTYKGINQTRVMSDEMLKIARNWKDFIVDPETLLKSRKVPKLKITPAAQEEGATIFIAPDGTKVQQLDN